MNSWFEQLNRLIARRESGELSEEAFQEQKKRLWQLQQDLDIFHGRLEKEEKRFADDDIFQMQILAFQIEEADLDLAEREARVLRLEEELTAAVAEAEARMVSTDASTVPLTHAEISPEEEATLLEETQKRVEELRSRIFILRSERLDPEFWTLSNQIDDALYRNGSEPVAQWHQRVLAQQKRLQEQ